MLVWLVTGVGTVAMSILGAAFGQTGLFAGAIVGGIAGSVLAVWLGARLTWIAKREHPPASAGAVVGFLVAVPIAALNLDGPVIPVLATALTGVGALIGVQAARQQ